MKPHISRCGLTIPSLCLQLATDTFGTGLQGLCRSLTMKTHLKKCVLVGLAKPCIQIYIHIYVYIYISIYIYKYHVTCVCVCPYVSTYGLRVAWGKIISHWWWWWWWWWYYLLWRTGQMFYARLYNTFYVSFSKPCKLLSLLLRTRGSFWTSFTMLWCFHSCSDYRN